MPTKPAPLTILTLPPAVLESARSESVAAISANQIILDRVSSLTITNQSTYLSADHELSLIRAARRHIQVNIIDPVKAPINASHKAILKLEHQLDDGIAAAESALRRKMSDYQVGERRKVEAREAEERARQEAEEKERREKEEAERRRQEDGLVLVQTEDSLPVMIRESQRHLIPTAHAYVPPVSIHSSSRPVQRVRVVNLDELLISIIEKHVPEDVISVTESALNRYLCDAPDVVKTWPGVEVFDDVQIRGR